MPRVVVIGAGIIGTAVAHGLAARGAEVIVLEARRPAVGTSSNSFAWANANDKPPEAYHALNAAGLAEHHRALADFGHAAFQPTGNLEVAVAPAEQEYLREKVARLHEWDYRAELIDENRAHQLEPDLALPSGGSATFGFFPDEGWVAAPVLAHAFLEAARSLGAEVRCPALATGLETRGSRIVGVATTAGLLAADVVVDCAGPAAGELLRPLGVIIARRRSPGLLLISEPLPTCLDRVVHFPGVHLRPDGAGRVRFGSTVVDDLLPEDGTVPRASELVREVQRRAAAVLPVLADAAIEAVRVGWRPMPEDGYSAVGAIDGMRGYYLAFTHSGVTLAPILGKLVAEEIVADTRRPELAPFRPDRLVRPTTP
jgi:glycine/D-amino acid oxidase-like deaminating enzyme